MTIRERAFSGGGWWRAVALAAALLVVGGVRVAEAHALLLRSEPAAGIVVAPDAPPRRISLWFSDPVSVSFNGVGVLDANGGRADGFDARAAADDPTRVDVSLGDLPQGAYAVRWQATSSDNHVVRGSYWFTVGFAAAPPPGALEGGGAPTAPPLEVVGRWLMLAAALALVGGALFRPLVVERFRAEPGIAAAFHDPSVRRRAGIVWIAASGALCIGQLLWASAQAESVAGVRLPQALQAGVPGIVLFGSGFGLLWWARTLLGLALGGLLAVAAPRGSWRGLALGTLLLLAISLGSHAAGARTLPALATALDVLHLGAASLWLGGLAQVAILLPALVRATPSGRRATLLRGLVPRVSSVALTSVLVLIATGLFSAWEQVASVRALIDTAYGQSLSLKLGLLGLLLGVAAVNLLVVRPRAASGRVGANGALPRLFHRLVLIETIVGAGLLLSVGLLSSLPPPGSAALPTTLEATRQAGDLRVSLAVDPNWVGISHYRVSLADTRGQPPGDVQSVVLTFAMDGMNMGRTTVFASPVSQGVYDVSGFYVGMPGISLVGVAISRPMAGDQSAVFRVEVPDVSYQQFSGLLGPSDGGLPTARADAARGQEVYSQHCLVCHGETGVGNGPAAASLLPPASDLTLHARWHPDDQLYWFISNGVAGTAMPAWADQLGAGERRDVITYLHELANAPSATPLVAVPASTRPTAVAAPSPVPGATVSVPLAGAGPQPARTATAAAVATQPAGQVTRGSVSVGLKGRLAFGPDTDGNLWVWPFPAEKPDRLTTLGPGEFTSHPAWSPDGQQVAFSYYKLPKTGSVPIPDGTDLYVASADGKQPRMVAVHDVRGAALQFPVWTPDGKAIYVGYRRQGGAEAHIDRVDVESGTRAQVVTNAGYPTISSDGRRLAYATSPYSGLGTGLWWSAPNGEDPHQILGSDVFLKFFGLRLSPDGRMLLFAALGAGNNYQPPSGGLPGLLGLLGRALAPPSAYADGEIYDLWTIDLDGRNLHRITTLAEDLPISAWAPDGQHIAFLGGGSASKAEAGLGVINPDGGSLRRLTTIPGHRGLDWTATP